MSVRRLPRLVRVATFALVLGGPSGLRAEPVTVRFPQGSCDSGWIEVQVYNRLSDRWVPHPTHPRVAAGQCHIEESGRLLNEIRVRCVDPSRRRRPSAWVVGANVWKPEPNGQCRGP